MINEIQTIPNNPKASTTVLLTAALVIVKFVFGIQLPLEVESSILALLIFLIGRWTRIWNKAQKKGRA